MEQGLLSSTDTVDIEVESSEGSAIAVTYVGRGLLAPPTRPSKSLILLSSYDPIIIERSIASP